MCVAAPLAFYLLSQVDRKLNSDFAKVTFTQTLQQTLLFLKDWSIIVTDKNQSLIGTV